MLKNNLKNQPSRWMFYINFVNIFEKLIILMSQIQAPNSKK